MEAPLTLAIPSDARGRELCQRLRMKCKSGRAATDWRPCASAAEWVLRSESRDCDADFEFGLDSAARDASSGAGAITTAAAGGSARGVRPDGHHWIPRRYESHRRKPGV